MAILNRGFGGAKMNKDVDERLLKSGEFRDALNAQISTSDASNVGSLQTLLGNRNLTEDVFDESTTSIQTARCVGSIADGKTNDIYWFVAGDEKVKTSRLDVNDTVKITSDYIVKYNVIDEELTYVFVDHWKIVGNTTNAAGTTDIADDTINFFSVDELKEGSEVRYEAADGSNQVTFTTRIGEAAGYPLQNATNQKIVLGHSFAGSVGTEVTVLGRDDHQTLGFSKFLQANPQGIITGINIINDFLCWTDNYGEPKKINIARSIKGTGGTNRQFIGQGDHKDFCTRVITKDSQGALTQIAGNTNLVEWAQEHNITVIKLNPQSAPTIEMSSSSADRVASSGATNPVVSSLDSSALMYDPLNNDAYVPNLNAVSLTFNEAADFRPGDIILLTNDLDSDPDTFVDADARVQILPNPATDDGLYNAYPDSIIAGPFTCQVLSVGSDVPSSGNVVKFLARLEQENSLFEFKFPRFAYRWKYVDGEYSAFSPFSEPAFLPSEFDYDTKKGYNLAMTNTLRSLSIKDYVHDSGVLPADVIEIDILYKEDSSPTVYTVKTINTYDTDNGAWPLNHAYNGDWGKLDITSEIIHAVVPSNQSLRPYDNVPRKALAQEVAANRLIFANYLQNYNLIGRNGRLLAPKVNLSLISAEHSSVQSGVHSAEKSIKTQRTYQIGLIYGDEYGRETPVLADKELGSITLKKDASCNANSLRAKVLSSHPYWAKYFKFYLKETANEYYNMAMDRWYDAEDGNIWISFPSSERNKVDIDTFLILKKGHANNVCVPDKARYKILAIENEAPLNIKVKEKVVLSYDDESPGNSNQGFPLKDFTFFTFTQASEGDIDYEALQNDLSDLFVRFSVDGQFTASYKVTSIHTDATQEKIINIEGAFGDDVLFLSPNQTFAGAVAGVTTEFTKKEFVNKPEFDGRFFVKIYKDLVLQQYVLNSEVNANYGVVRSLDVSWMHTFNQPLLPNSGITANSAQFGEAGELTGDNASEFYGGDYTWGDNGNTDQAGGGGNTTYFHQRNPGDDGASLLDDGTSAPGEFWKSWCSGTAGRVQCFIDQAWAASYDGRKMAPDMDGSPLNAVGLPPGDLGWNGEDDVPPISAINKTQAGIEDELNGFQNGGRGFHTNNDGKHIMELSVTGWHPSDNTGGGLQNVQLHKFVLAQSTGLYDSGAYQLIHDQTRDFFVELREPGKRFRFSSDPNQVVYEVDAFKDFFVIYNCNRGGFLGGNSGYFDNFRKRNKFAFKYHAVVDGSSVEDNWDPRSEIAYDGTERTRIEIVEPLAQTGDTLSTDNPAIFETEPKEAVDVDIYYEISRGFPIELEVETGEPEINQRANEEYWSNNNVPIAIKYGAAGSSIPAGTFFQYINGSNTPKEIKLQLSQTATLVAGDVLEVSTRWNDKVTFVVATSATSNLIHVEEATHNNEIELGWFNCYSFGNGVESNRIRDAFNQPVIAKGVRASSTIAEPYEEERRQSGFIFSGIYNSNSGVNNLNQFIQAEPITKDLNPDYGSIQKLHLRNTNILTLCEDKCLQVLTDKDALFNADGTSNVTSGKSVLGSATPIAGEYGISTNPESFASDEINCYFTDIQRRAVVSVSGGGAMAISELGMKDYFNVQMNSAGSNTRFIGSYDDKKTEYNISLTRYNQVRGYRAGSFTSKTITYDPTAKGWLSFKSFVPESAVSINGEYYTFRNASLWKHHSNSTRNNFYGRQYKTTVDVMFNDDPSAVKSFGSISYEGTQSHIDAFASVVQDGVTYTDQEFYNLTDKKGWFVESIVTDLQTGSASNFKNKEGKWFANIKGDDNTPKSVTQTGNETGLNGGIYSLDTSEFSTQGIGMATLSSSVTIQSGVDLVDKYWVIKLAGVYNDELVYTTSGAELAEVPYVGLANDGPYSLANSFINSNRYTEYDKPQAGTANQINSLIGGDFTNTFETTMKDVFHFLKPHNKITAAAGSTAQYNDAINGVSASILLPQEGSGVEIDKTIFTVGKTTNDPETNTCEETFEGSCKFVTSYGNRSHNIWFVEFKDFADLTSQEQIEVINNGTQYPADYTSAQIDEARLKNLDTCLNLSAGADLNNTGDHWDGKGCVVVYYTYPPTTFTMPASSDLYTDVTYVNENGVADPYGPSIEEHWVDIDLKQSWGLTSTSTTEAVTAFEVVVEHGPGKVTTVADIDVRTPNLTLHSKTPATIGTGDDGVVTVKTPQTFIYTASKVAVDTNGKVLPIALPTITTTASTDFNIGRVDSSFDSLVAKHGEQTEGYVDIIKTEAVLNVGGKGDVLNQGGSSLIGAIAESIAYYPAQTREKWEVKTEKEAKKDPIKVKIASTAEVTSTVETSSVGRIQTLDASKLPKTNKGKIAPINVFGKPGTEYYLVVKRDNDFYNFATNEFNRIPNPIIKTIGTNRASSSRVVIPRATADTVTSVWIEPVLATTTLDSSVPTNENSAVSSEQRIPITITYGLAEGTGSDWSSISAAATTTGIPLSLAKRTNASAYKSFSFTAVASGKTITGIQNFGDDALIRETLPTGDGASVTIVDGAVAVDSTTVTVTGILYISRFGKNAETISIDLDKITTLA